MLSYIRAKPGRDPVFFVGGKIGYFRDVLGIVPGFWHLSIYVTIKMPQQVGRGKPAFFIGGKMRDKYRLRFTYKVWTTGPIIKIYTKGN